MSGDAVRQELSGKLMEAFDAQLAARELPTAVGREDRRLLCDVIATGVVEFLRDHQKPLTIDSVDFTELEAL